MIDGIATELQHDDLLATTGSGLDLRRIRNSERNHHTAQFYVEDEHLARSVGRFLGRSIAAGDSVIVIATQEHTSAFEQVLARELYLDVELLKRSGRFRTLDAPRTLVQILRNGAPDPELFHYTISSTIDHIAASTKTANPRVAVYGELVALLSDVGNHSGALALERLWNAYIANRPITLRCGYPMRAFARRDDGPIFQAICAEHAEILPAGSDDLAGTHSIESAGKLERGNGAHREELHSVDAHKSTLDATRDAFLAAAAHELKTPVTSLRVYAQLLQRDLARKHDIAPDRLASALHAFERQTIRLNDLVGQLIDVAEIEAGAFHLNCASHDVVGLIRRTIAEDFSRVAHEIMLEGDDRAVSNIDRARIRQVVSILIENATKFSPAGSRIVVQIERRDSGNRFSVADQGPGIDHDERERIFERFHHTGQRHIDGLGLGLYVARQIVLRHGGTIHAEEPEQPGARFVVTLPALS